TVGPPPPSTVTLTKPTEPTEPSNTATTGIRTSGQAMEHIDFNNPLYREMLGLDVRQNPNDTFFKHDTTPASSEEGVREFSNPMYDDINGGEQTVKFNLDSRYIPGGEDTSLWGIWTNEVFPSCIERSARHS
ncbi:hypothetical protein OS493_040019, partial [Desmophyllum pertusum]